MTPEIESLKAKIAKAKAFVEKSNVPEDEKAMVRRATVKMQEQLDSLEAKLNKAKDEVKEAKKHTAKPASAHSKAKSIANKKHVETEKRKTIKETTQKLKSLVEKYKNAGVDIGRDEHRKALPPGKRISKNGNVYYESRLNRSDVQRKKYPYLEQGGEVSQPEPMKYEGRNIDVFGYETKNFDMCHAAAPEFEGAISEIELMRDETLNYENQSKALSTMAQKVDAIMGIGKDIAMTGEHRGVTLETMEAVSTLLQMVGIFNFRSGMRVDTGFLANCVYYIATGEMKRYADGGEVSDTFEGDEQPEYEPQDDHEIGEQEPQMRDDIDFEEVSEPEMVEETIDRRIIPNNYAGKTPADVWDDWTIAQRKHFISDHMSRFMYEKDIEELWEHYKGDYAQLPVRAKEEIDRHVKEGQYAKGGMVSMSALPANIHELVDQGKVTYRGTGSSDAWRIKVSGKEYTISREDFYKLGSNSKMRFAAPERKHYAKGGSTSEIKDWTLGELSVRENNNGTFSVVSPRGTIVYTQDAGKYKAGQHEFTRYYANYILRHITDLEFRDVVALKKIHEYEEKGVPAKKAREIGIKTASKVKREIAEKKKPMTPKQRMEAIKKRYGK